ncbi:helix-turn-helix domain-containing protein, partial [Escherichia coli]
MVHEDKARKEFASRLALACENAGYEQHGRQAEIARRMKLTPKAVSKWFNGETIPRREKLRELATLIGTTPTYLLREGKKAGTKWRLSRRVTKCHAYVTT